MMPSRVLGAFRAEMAAKSFHFDPTNKEHVSAYSKLEAGTQCDEHRFLLVPADGEPLFDNVLDLMRYRLAQHYCKEVLKD